MSDQANGTIGIAAATAVSAPLTKLIETCSAGLGRLYEPTHLRRMAKAESERMLILASASIQAGELEHRALQRLSAVESRRQANIEKIVDAAAAELPTAVSGTPVDSDWAARFFEECKDVSSERMQQLWAQALQQEISTPGSFSVRSMRVLSALSSFEISSFSQLCSMTFAGGMNTPFALPAWQGFFDQVGLTYQEQKNLEAAGLIHIEPRGLEIRSFKGPLCLNMLGGPAAPLLIGIRQSGDTIGTTIRQGVVGFTTAGVELSRLWRGSVDYSHAARVAQLFTSLGWRAELVKPEPTPNGHGYLCEMPDYWTDYWQAHLKQETSES